MNIFVLDNDAVESARMMCDKHVVKMIVETAQLLSTAHHVIDGQQIKIVGKRSYNTYKCDKPNICKATMINHPCSIWTRENSANYKWLWKHGFALLGEYKERYNKIHAMTNLIYNDLYEPPFNIKKEKKTTPFAQAMPEQYKNKDAIIAYREYYLNEKTRFAKWKNNNTPKWFAEKNPIIGLMEEVPF